MLVIYRFIVMVVLTLGSPYLLAKAIFGRHGIRERLGFIPQRRSAARLFWFHAASVGELKILSSVIPEIKKLLPGIEIAISTTTATGKRRAKELFGESAMIVHQPLELNSAILRTLENLRPEKLILVETELWPLLLTTSSDWGVELDLINARMSPGSFNTYRWFRPLFSRVLGRFRHVLARSQADADRFDALGARNPVVVGNVKFDQVLVDGNSREPALQISNSNRLVFVAGSLRKGEDRILAETISSASNENLPVFFVLVPRHMKDLDDLCRLLQGREIKYRMWTETDRFNVDTSSVLVVNTMGELNDFYKSADLAFVGGSLVPIGGHDPTEPAALGKPVVFGPFMGNADMSAKLLLDSGGAMSVKDDSDLLSVLRHAVSNRSELVEKGEKCRRAVLSMAGASRKIALILAGEQS